MNKIVARTIIRLGWQPKFPSDENIRFLVLVPTVRKGLVEDTMRHLMGTFSYPTDFFLMDGAVGKAQVLNFCLTRCLNLRRHTFYATIDDDMLMPPQWQNDAVAAFRNIPRLGAVGLDYENTDVGNSYIGGRNPEQQYKGIRYREPRLNLPGGNIITHSKYALAAGTIPILPGIRFSFYEDGWRCGKIKELHLRTLYIIGQEPTKILFYNETPDYYLRKLEDSKRSHALKENRWRWLAMRLLHALFPYRQ